MIIEQQMAKRNRYFSY